MREGMTQLLLTGHIIGPHEGLMWTVRGGGAVRECVYWGGGASGVEGCSGVVVEGGARGKSMMVIRLSIMFASEALEAIWLVVIQPLLTGHAPTGTYFVTQLCACPAVLCSAQAPACCLWLLLGACVMEWPNIIANGHQAIPGENLGLFFLAACMGFAVNTLAYATIKLASSLTLKVLGCVKNGLVIIAAIALFAEEVTWTQGVGYLLSTGAFLVYVHIKMVQIAAGGENMPATPTKAAGK